MVQHAHGCWLTDTEGKEYLDGASGALVVNLGHEDTRVTSAITRQLDAVSYVHPSAFNSSGMGRPTLKKTALVAEISK